MVHDRYILDNQSSIHSGITTSHIKHVPVIPLGTEQQYTYKKPQLSSISYLVTEKSKVKKSTSHKKLQLKEKDSTPSSQYISSSLVSTKVYHTIKSEKK